MKCTLNLFILVKKLQKILIYYSIKLSIGFIPNQKRPGLSGRFWLNKFL